MKEHKQREEKALSFEELREEIIDTLRLCGFSDEEIFRDLDSTPYGRQTERE